MQTYNQINQGNIMPLLMNFTNSSPIQDGFEMPHMEYNDIEQISYEMRMVCTRCAKMRPKTRKMPGSGGFVQDLKNENDDTKSVR